MRPDVISDIKAYNDPNSCNSPSDEPLYTITEWDGTELLHQTKVDAVDYVRDELKTVLVKLDVQSDDDAFETAKEYLELTSAIMEEQL
ncbi:hypothetical protein [Ligilactobacillus animalis]|uniref:hypothetical protein n=1 Tax=Ligilactobacillus animalis TaxID=1605 RepID=UPI0010A2F441|nr:hypothetical protein [Ligilactobacillus animalis]THE20208.1 hypothetical protein ACH45_07695 [Ligilactobacillus animalis]THE21408.1 hypothetical protein ACH44_04265 [Ligilactobacillus animalis]